MNGFSNLFGFAEVLDITGIKSVEAYLRFDLQTNQPVLNDKLTNSKKPNIQQNILSFIVTRNCNFDCAYCFTKDIHQKMDKNTAKSAILAFKKIIKEGAPTKFSFFGGEPTLEMDLIKYIVGLIEENFKDYMLVISSNGYFDKKTADYLIEKNFIINISFDGLPELQKNRPLKGGQDTTKKVSKTIRYLGEKDAVFRIRSTIVDTDSKYFPEIIKNIAKLKGYFVQIEPVTIGGRAKGLNRPLKEDFIENFIKANRIGKSLEVEVITSIHSDIYGMNGGCTALIGQNKIVLPDGYVSRCYEVQDTRHNNANIFVTEKLDMKNNEFVNVPNKLEESMQGILSKVCNECYLQSVCKGGCLARHLNANIDETMCYLKKNLFKYVLIDKFFEFKEGEYYSAPYIQEIDDISKITQEGLSKYIADEFGNYDTDIFIKNLSGKLAYVILDSNQNIRGFVSLKPLKDRIRLADIVIDSNSRSQGLGKAIIQKLIKTAEQNSLNLETSVSKINPKAFNFYKEQGFIIHEEKEKRYDLFLELNSKKAPGV